MSQHPARPVSARWQTARPPLGIGTSRTLKRMAAPLDQLDQAHPCIFLPRDNVPHGGLLCALPALLVMGLLRHTGSHFNLPK